MGEGGKMTKPSTRSSPDPIANLFRDVRVFRSGTAFRLPYGDYRVSPAPGPCQKIGACTRIGSQKQKQGRGGSRPHGLAQFHKGYRTEGTTGIYFHRRVFGHRSFPQFREKVSFLHQSFPGRCHGSGRGRRIKRREILHKQEATVRVRFKSLHCAAAYDNSIVVP